MVLEGGEYMMSRKACSALRRKDWGAACFEDIISYSSCLLSQVSQNHMSGHFLQFCQMRAQMSCQREPAFGEMLAAVRSESLLEDRLKRLAHQLSDANLQQMPEFHQRVEVLRQLGYIAADDTVEMKVRTAACTHRYLHG